jgi:hypothetical protein
LGSLTRHPPAVPRRSRPFSEPDLFSVEVSPPTPMSPSEPAAAIMPDEVRGLGLEDVGRVRGRTAPYPGDRRVASTRPAPAGTDLGWRGPCRPCRSTARTRSLGRETCPRANKRHPRGEPDRHQARQDRPGIWCAPCVGQTGHRRLLNLSIRIRHSSGLPDSRRCPPG